MDKTSSRTIHISKTCGFCGRQHRTWRFRYFIQNSRMKIYDVQEAATNIKVLWSIQYLLKMQFCLKNTLDTTTQGHPATSYAFIEIFDDAFTNTSGGMPLITLSISSSNWHIVCCLFWFHKSHDLAGHSWWPRKETIFWGNFSLVLTIISLDVWHLATSWWKQKSSFSFTTEKKQSESMFCNGRCSQCWQHPQQSTGW